MNQIVSDLRYAIRMLMKTPGFTAVAIFTLAVGIGANTAIFSVVNGVLLRPLPYPDPDDVVLVYSANERTRRGTSSYPNYRDWRERNQSFEDLATFTSSSFTWTGAGEPERLTAARVSASFFSLLRVKPLYGRTFSAEEDTPEGPKTVVLSHRLWARRFASDPAMLERTLTLDGNPFQVIGVLAPDFNFPLFDSDTDIYTSNATAGVNWPERGAQVMTGLARLKRGVTSQQAQADMEGIAEQLGEQYPNTNLGLTVQVVGLHEELVGDLRTGLWVLLGAVAFVLLIACANVANLLLARVSTRQKEIAVRAALGASRARIIRQLTTESLLLALTGGAAGLLLASWGVDALVAIAPQDLPRLTTVGIDGRVLLFTLAASAFTGVAVGVISAIRFSGIDINLALKDGGRTLASGGGRNLRGTLMVAEIAFAIVLLAGAGLLVKSFVKLLQVDPGFDSTNVLTARVSLPRQSYASYDKRVRFFDEAVERIEALPGVESAAFISQAPFSHSNIFSSFVVIGAPPSPSGQVPESNVRAITPGYFDVMKIPIRQGRRFNAGDIKGRVGAVIINEALAEKYFAGEDPLGKRLNIGVIVDDDEAEEWQIVGLVGDVKHAALDRKAQPEIYVPFKQKAWRGGHLVVRGATDVTGLTGAIRSEILTIDKDQPVYGMELLDQLISGTLTQQRFYMLLLAAFAGAGLLLALVGVYGVLSYTVSQSTREIGIRIALGARRADILKLVVGHGMLLAAAGISIGLLGAFALTRVLSSLLFEVSATDATTFAAIAVITALVALLACYLPARRATKIEPIIALRYE